MPNLITRLRLSLVLWALAGFSYVLLTNAEKLRALPALNDTTLLTFKTMFVSIVLEAFPFILLGVLISSVLEVFVSDDFVRRLIPKNPVLGVMVSCVLGFVFPICECGMIPVARRLVKKGMPLYSAVVFLLAGPILNPIVFVSTYMAFRSHPEIVYTRMGLAFAVAAAAGLVVYRFVRTNPLRPAPGELLHYSHNHQHDHHHPHDHDHHHHNHSNAGKMFSTFEHASAEFFDMGKYLVFGALLTALIQTFMDRGSLVSIGQSEWASQLFMMGFAYILSICSTSDAFVASSFTTTFTSGSLIAFLVFGPMLDMKSTLMLLSVFKAKFVALIAFLIVTLVSIASFIVERFVL
jgi:uncharacterized protein